MKCETCRFWGKKSDSSPRRDCMQITQYRGSEDALAYVYEESPLETLAEFGCVLWESGDPTETVALPEPL